MNMTLQQIVKFFSDIHSKNKACYKKSLKKKNEHSFQLPITHKDFIVKQFVDALFP